MEYRETIDSESFCAIQRGVGFGEANPLGVAKALKNSAKIIAAYENGQAVGMGRVIGDFGRICYIQDLFILPQWQGKGIGTEILRRLLCYIQENIEKGASLNVCLMAAKGRESFYEKYGFTSRPNDHQGAGMQKTLHSSL